jgi:ubiquinone/menaquinone biosynthesis C-methylase UbiE
MAIHGHHAHEDGAAPPPSHAAGILLRSPRLYDLQVWLALGGREAALRAVTLDKARLARGDSVLDVGCGTGGLLLAAMRRGAGAVAGVDAASEMVDATARKVRRAGFEIEARQGVAQDLPFADGRFDLVTSTLMLHHLPRPARAACVREMGRVAKPGGRVLAVDFGTSSMEQGGWLRRLHRHGRVKADELGALLLAGGFRVLETGTLKVRDLNYVLATPAERGE